MQFYPPVERRPVTALGPCEAICVPRASVEPFAAKLQAAAKEVYDTLELGGTKYIASWRTYTAFIPSIVFLWRANIGTTGLKLSRAGYAKLSLLSSARASLTWALFWSLRF